jgi:hypothetical protein
MALKLAGVEACDADLAVEAHANYAQSRDVRGWCVIHGPGDELGRMVAGRISERWARAVVDLGVGRDCPVRERSDLYLAREIPARGVCFVLPELGNLGVAKIRGSLHARGDLWWRLVEGCAAALEVIE